MDKRTLKDLIFECYVDILRKQNGMLCEENKKMVYSEGEQLPTATEQILAKFPTLKHCLIRLQTEEFMNFDSSIDWISPRPSVFRVNLKNGQNILLKWMGKDFEAEIQGKKYYLGRLVDFQRALQKLAIVYQEGPMGEEESEDQNSSFESDNQLDLSGQESEEISTSSPTAPSETSESEPVEDLSKDNVDFEFDSSI